jgi:hypothetical protein
MLTTLQLSKLSVEDRNRYEELLRENDTESLAQFEYFFGFTITTDTVLIPSNAEIDLYKNFTDKVKLKHIAQMLGFVPHAGQQPIFYTIDEQRDIVNNLAICCGRRFGKSINTSVIAARELAVPFSSTILLTPTFNNAKIIFNEVLKNIQKLQLPIKNINRGSFRFELENGARFSANSAANIESALGSYNSLLIVDEAQSVPDLMEIINQMLVPTLLDYGVRPSGILYGKQIYIGTPRGVDNQLYDLFIKEDEFPNWKSFSAPSTTNPILPQSYFAQMRLELGEMLYRQEILAEFFGTDDNVFWAFNKEVNTYAPGTVQFNSYMNVVSGIDIGFRDSTAQLWAYRDSKGNYYIDKAYQKNMTSTATHVANYREIEASMYSRPEMRYIDPAAAQTAFDLQSTYDYDCVGANNSIDASIAYINQLLTPTGADNKPRLFISQELHELIRQLTRVRWKDRLSKGSKDPFMKDPKGTHWDLIAALRYMLYSDSFNLAAGSFIVSSGR